MNQPNSSIHISRHIDSLIDIIESDAISLEGLSLHCTFVFDIEERWLNELFNKAWSKGVKTISFTNCTVLNNPIT